MNDADILMVAAVLAEGGVDVRLIDERTGPGVSRRGFAPAMCSWLGTPPTFMRPPAAKA